MHTTPTARYVFRKQENAGLRCNSSRCAHLRYGLEGHCRAHYETARRYGDPSAGPLRRAAIRPFTHAVRELWSLPANASHAGLSFATSWADSMLAAAAHNCLSFAGGLELQRLSEHGITGRQVLEAVVGTALYLQAHPRALPSDRARDFALSRSAFLLAPQRLKVSYASGRAKAYGAKPRRSALLHIGKELRVNLAGLVAISQLGVEAMRTKAARTAAEVDAVRAAPFLI